MAGTMGMTPDPQAIREHRELTGRTVGQLAEAAQITAAYLSQIENGHRRNVSPPIMGRLANALGVAIVALVARS
jgi:transcriptional regulator with XRE-family HTH domain